MSENPMSRYVQIYPPRRQPITGVGWEHAKVNWSAIGPVPPQEALAFADAVRDAANLAIEQTSEALGYSEPHD